MILSDSRHLAKINAEMTLDSTVKMREQISGTGSYNSRKLSKSFLGSRPLTRGPDPSSKATLWVKAQHEGAGGVSLQY